MGICTEQFRRVIGGFNASRPLFVCGKYVSQVGSGVFPSAFQSFGIIFYAAFMVFFVIFGLSPLLHMNLGNGYIKQHLNLTVTFNSLLHLSNQVTLLNCKFICIYFQTILFYKIPSYEKVIQDFLIKKCL